MSELTVDVLISNVLNGMVQILDNGQMKKLKEQLYIELHDVDITNKHYELAETINENDMMKLNYFAASLRVSKSTFIAANSTILTLSGLKLMEVHSKSKNTTILLFLI